MHRRNHRACRVEDNGDSCGESFLRGDTQLRRKWICEVGRDVREIYAGFLEYRSVLEHTRPPASPVGVEPEIFLEAGAVIYALECGTNMVLKLLKEIPCAVFQRRDCRLDGCCS